MVDKQESKSVDDLINSLGEKVGLKAKEEFIASSYAKIEQILLAPLVPLTQVQKPIEPPPMRAVNESVLPIVQEQPVMPTPISAVQSPPSNSGDKKGEAEEKLKRYYENKPISSEKSKQKHSYDKTRIIIVSALIAGALLALVLSGALAQSVVAPSISVSPDNSNIVQVLGYGFNASSAVTLLLSQNNTLAASFEASVMTDVNGSFTAIYIIPTSLSGSFILTASTGSVNAEKTITVPDLHGAAGIDGVDGESFNATGSVMVFNGTDGVQGEKGDQGVMGNSSAAIIAICLSIAALVIVILPKKKT